ncbi:3-oxoacyl-ACP synthase [candidate division MSBL1 archaeon SCGC-AAA259I09]|uniref:3-oxoacyl-ACP synthase n=2 Tax=candidate division MSBL1 TaxID=215777 RepID=A0A133UT25_9EURY|nr:3-oxoacyl-ACP synthase [candidate division MSBL1 archaeon SCGC-AAA259I09]KXA98828.1 3-oxoacyl-ACP synthase [candidate division MSBL1 archaeon SCGC-AAA259J03]
MKGLKDKVVLVTGSGRGIGKKTAKKFAEEGAKVVIGDVDTESVTETVEEIEGEGRDAMGVELDVTNLEGVEKVMQKIVDEFGGLDVLVNNAGITADSLLVKMSEDQFDRVVDVNLKGTFNCGREAAKLMLEQGSGVILNASSVSGVYGNIGQTNYVATKFGVIGMTKTWAKELGPKGIRVNAVAPGYTKTRMLDSVPEKVLDNIREDTPMKRLGEPEEIANVYAYLASKEASYINGEVVEVTGGLVM